MGARWIHDIVPDNDGNAWGTRDRGPVDMTLFKIDTKTGQVAGFSVKNGQSIRRSHSIAKDRNGIIWFDGGDGTLGRLDPEDGSVQDVHASAEHGRRPADDASTSMPSGRSGARPQGGANRFDPETETWTHFTSVTYTRNFVYGTAGDAEGNGWWTQYTADKVVKADPKTGKTYEVVMRPPWVNVEDVTTPADREWYKSMGVMTWGNINTVPYGQQPRRLGADKRGDSVLGAEQCGQQPGEDQHPHARNEVLPGSGKSLFRHGRQGFQRLDESVRRRESGQAQSANRTVDVLHAAQSLRIPQHLG